MGMQNAMTQGMEGSERQTIAQWVSNEETPGSRANLKRKRSLEPEEENEDSLRRTRGKHINYHHLYNPFSNNEDKDEIINTAAMVSDKSFSIAANDGKLTLKEARKLNEWPEWEKAIKAELA